MKCPAWHAECNYDMKCSACRLYPCKNSWRYARMGHPPASSNCFRCKHALAVPMGIECSKKKSR